MKSMTGVFFSD